MRRRTAFQDEARLAVLLADFEARTQEIRERVGHEHKSYLQYFTSLVAVLLAAAAADRLGHLLQDSFRTSLAPVFLAIAVFLLFLPLDAINEQIRIRLLAVYIERSIRPLAVEVTGAEQILAWEPFQSTIMFRIPRVGGLISVMLGIRALVGYAPSLAAVGYWALGGIAFRDPSTTIVEWTLVGVWFVVALIPLALAIWLSVSRTLRLS